MKNMSYSHHVVCFVFSCVMVSAVFAVEQEKIPQQVKDWQKAAQDSSGKGLTDKAVEYYEKIIQSDPKMDYAMQAQAGVAVVYLKANKTVDADNAVQKLLTDYADNPDVAKSIREVSTAYLSANLPTQSKQLCRMALSKWPNHADAVLMLRNLAMAHAQLGEFAETETATAKLLKNYSGNSELPKGIRKIASCYFKAQRPDKTKELCQMALSTWPDHSEAIFTRRDLAISHIRLGEYEEAESVTAHLIADYSDHAEIGNCISRIASYYFAPLKPQKAKELCQLALSNWPDHSDKAKTLSILADSMIKLGEIKQADELTAKLINSYPDRAETGNHIRKAAHYYLWYGQPLKAKELYQTVLQKWPQAQDIALAQAGLAAACLQLGDSSSAETATTTLLSDFKGHKDFAFAVTWLADQYSKNNNNSKAMDLYDYVLSLNPDENVQLRRGAGIAHVYVCLGDDVKVREKVDYLLSLLKQTNSNDVATYIFEIGQEYYLMAEKAAKAAEPNKINPPAYQKAVTVWQRFEQAVPDHNSPQYAYFSGVVCQRLGQHEQAISHFQRVVSKWPNYEKAWHAQYLIGGCYISLNKAGQLSESDMKNNVINTYKYLLEKYPLSPVVSIAQKKIKQMQEERELR